MHRLPAARPRRPEPDKRVRNRRAHRPIFQARALPPLAEQVLEQYQEADPRTYLGNVFKAQLVAGRYAEAIASIRRLRVLLSTEEPTRDTTANLQFEIFALAKVREAAEHSSFEQAFRSVFRETVRSLDAKEASDVIRSFGSTLASFEEDLIKSVASHRDGRAFVDTRDAVDLVTKYALVGAYQSFRPLSADLIAEDDDRRYVIDNDATIRAADGAELHAIVVRPRIPARPLPTLFTLTIYAGTINFGEARRNAAHGYAAVVAYSRGKGGSPDAVAPYEHDAEDGVFGDPQAGISARREKFSVLGHLAGERYRALPFPRIHRDPHRRD